MRILLSVVMSLGLAFGMYLIFLHSVSKAGGGSPQATTATVTVQMQMVNLAQAERLHFVQNNSYATIDQLSSSGEFTLPNPDPDGYAFSVEVTGAGFTATAQHASASGNPDNYPVFTIDQTMQVHRVEPQAASDTPSDGAKASDGTKASDGAKTSDGAKQDGIPEFPTSLPSLPAGLSNGTPLPAPAPQN